MKRRSFLALMGALAGVGFLPKVAAKPVKTVPSGCKLIKPTLVPPGPPIPVGHITAFAGETIPAGWLPCDGRVISPKEFPKLCAVMGEPYKLWSLSPKVLMHAVHEPADLDFIPMQYIVKAK